MKTSSFNRCTDRFAMLLRVLACAMTIAGTAEAAPPPSARASYEEGLQAYQQQRYQPAADAFERAYAISGTPLILFNIGQCYRKLGVVPRALEAYRRYLAIAPTTDPPATANEARGYIRELEAPAPRPEPLPTLTPSPSSTPTATATVNLTPTPTAKPAPAVAVVARHEPVKARRPLLKNPWLWTGVGVAVAAGLAVGLGVGLTRDGGPTPATMLGTQTAKFP